MVAWTPTGDALVTVDGVGVARVTAVRPGVSRILLDGRTPDSARRASSEIPVSLPALARRLDDRGAPLLGEYL